MLPALPSLRDAGASIEEEIDEETAPALGRPRSVERSALRWRASRRSQVGGPKAPGRPGGSGEPPPAAYGY